MDPAAHRPNVSDEHKESLGNPPAPHAQHTKPPKGNDAPVITTNASSSIDIES